MYGRTQFSELLKFFPKSYFNAQVKAYNSDKYSKTFKSWNLFVLVFYGHLTNSKSMRSMLSGYNSQTPYHYHLNTGNVKRSTLSEALRKRSYEPFEKCCEYLMKQVHKNVSKDVNSLISILDSTPIPLRGNGYEWTQHRSAYRIPGLKAHFAINGDKNTPYFLNISDSNVNDITVMKTHIEIEKGVTYIMDKAYLDYNWWNQIDLANAKFVTRIKVNTKYEVIENNRINVSQESNILSDETIHLTNKKPRAGAINNYAFKNLRLVTAKRENGNLIHIITNDFERSAEEISDLYKQRWQIELFFKWLKQKLKLKTFFGKSENAVKIQIYIAVICYLLIQLLKEMSKTKQTISEIANQLRHGIFNRIDLINYHARRKEKLLNLSRNQEVLL